MRNRERGKYIYIVYILKQKSVCVDLKKGNITKDFSLTAQSITILPDTALQRYMADMTPTEKAMLTDRNCPLVSLLVFT